MGLEDGTDNYNTWCWCYDQGKFQEASGSLGVRLCGLEEGILPPPSALRNKLCAICHAALGGHRQPGLPGTHREGSLTLHLPVAFEFP